MLTSRSLLQITAVAGLAMLPSDGARAQWWRSPPADFEACADIAEKAASKEEKAAKLSECNARFAGRRKPGGGYTYFDFMQNRNFDIAGPNPTPEEQRKIDEEYIVYLENQRRSRIAAAFTAKQQEQQAQPVSLKSEPMKVPIPVASPLKQQAAIEARARLKAGTCVKGQFSCDWPLLSEGINELKKLFGGAQAKPPKRGGGRGRPIESFRARDRLLPAPETFCGGRTSRRRMSRRRALLLQPRLIARRRRRGRRHRARRRDQGEAAQRHAGRERCKDWFHGCFPRFAKTGAASALFQGTRLTA